MTPARTGDEAPVSDGGFVAPSPACHTRRVTSDQPDGEEVQPQVMIDPGQMAGVWANYARVSHSPYEFTLDFVRLDFTMQPTQGIVVARVSLSPLMVTQLIDALTANWAKYAQRSMPPEVSHDEPTEASDTDAGEGGEAADPSAEAPGG